MVQNQTYLLADGTLTESPDQALRDMVAQWRRWSYYKLKYKEVD